MPVRVATHSGPFHADDVLAWALIRVFMDPEATLVRTRDADCINEADIVVDVGGIYDPERGRFDHHQTSYQGLLSSAGMVLNWLCSEGHVGTDLADYLRSTLIEYVDAVDNGRRTPEPGVPCFASLVRAFAQGHDTLDEFTSAFREAGLMAETYVGGLIRGFQKQVEAKEAVASAMREAEDAGNALLDFDQYYHWKPAYFGMGGATHPTDFVLMPGVDGTWRVLAIPPSENSFAQKRPLPSEWAGLTGEALARVVGVAGSIFCHKNRFIAVFQTKEDAVTALTKHGLMRR